jgi:hypothetical protein
MCNNRNRLSPIKHPPPVIVLVQIMEEHIASSTVVANGLKNETVKRSSGFMEHKIIENCRLSRSK